MMMNRMAASALALLVLAPAAVQSQESVRLLGEVRVRGEAERQATFDTTDAFTLLRARLGVEAQLSPRALVFLQVQDARTFGEEANTLAGSAERLDLHQGWLQYRADVGGHGLSFRAGRQEVVLGNERLVGAVGWSNTGRSFDGLRVTLGPEQGWRLNGLVTNVSERGRRLTGSTSSPGDNVFMGAYLETARADLFVLQELKGAYRQASGVDRTTLGGRLVAPSLGGLDASLEGAYQLGNQLWGSSAVPGTQDIGAWMLGARLGYATQLAALPRVGLGLDVLSGDADPTDGTYGAFNTLYATNHKFYGTIDLFLDPAARTRERGLVDGIASLRVALPRDLALDIDGHAFWLQEQFATSTDRMLGWELDLTLPVSLGTGQSLLLGYSLFRNGAAAPLVGLGQDGSSWHWAFIQATFAFGGRTAPIL
jgi:hypothetical protein